MLLCSSTRNGSSSSWVALASSWESRHPLFNKFLFKVFTLCLLLRQSDGYVQARRDKSPLTFGRYTNQLAFSRDFSNFQVPGPQDHGTFKVSRSCPVPSLPGTSRDRDSPVAITSVDQRFESSLIHVCSNFCLRPELPVQFRLKRKKKS